jgi:hypothetical protein
MKVKCAMCGKAYDVIWKKTSNGRGALYPREPDVWICEEPCRRKIVNARAELRERVE